VQHNGAYANLASTDEAFEVGLNRAVAILADKKNGRGGRGAAAAPLKELGDHPVTGKPVRILAGRFGPYIKHEAVNANIPRGADPLHLTLDEAVALLAAREGKPSGRRKPPKGAAGAKRAPTEAKKTAVKPKKKRASRKKPVSESPAEREKAT
jgi:DNA topoisomerase-1